MGDRTMTVITWRIKEPGVRQLLADGQPTKVTVLYHQSGKFYVHEGLSERGNFHHLKHAQMRGMDVFNNMRDMGLEYLE